MKLEKWALVANIVSGFAIIITLLFLTVELRTNSNLVERQIALDITNRQSRTILESESLAKLMAHIEEVDGTSSPAKAQIMDRYGFDSVEAELVTRYFRQQWQGYEADFNSGRTDYLRDRLTFMLGFPDQKLFWEYETGQRDSEFVRFVTKQVIPNLDVRAD